MAEEKKKRALKSAQDDAAPADKQTAVKAAEEIEKKDKKKAPSSSKTAKGKKKKGGLSRAEHRAIHKTSKRYLELKTLVDGQKRYELEEAIELAQKTSTVKFDASVDMHVRLQIDKSKPETLIRGSIQLPHGTGRKVRVAAFVSPEKVAEAKEAGADIVGGQELIDEIAKTGKCDFDVAVATPDMMKLMGKIARTLGQKGLMPSPKTETITPTPSKAIKALSAGKVSFKTDETGNIHQTIGKTSFDKVKLVENFNAVLDAVKKGKPESVKGAFVSDVHIATTMGPGIRVSFVA